MSNTRGLPWTNDDFQISYQKECKRVLDLIRTAASEQKIEPDDAETMQAAVKAVKLHGLRCNAVVSLYEIGLDDSQIAAIVGHETLKMTRQYGRTVAKQKTVYAHFAILETG